VSAKFLALLYLVIGLSISIFAANALARSTGYATEGWLISAFGLGILLLSQVSVVRLQHEVNELRARAK
jgi:hypothetical protein